MSTMGLSSWAVDLKDVSTVYPFAGSETLMTIICVVLWLAFHIIQIKSENGHWDSLSNNANNEDAKNSIDRY